MAVTFVAAGSTTYSTKRYVTIAKPAAVQAGDYLLYLYVIGKVSSTELASPASVPSGFSLIAGGPGTGYTYDDGNFRVEIELYAKFAGSSEPASYEFDYGSSDVASQGLLLVYRGVDPTTPLDTGVQLRSVPRSSGTGATHRFLSLTTVTANTMLVALGQDWGDNTANLTPPTGFTERVDLTLVYAADKVQAATGATGDFTMTNNSTNINPNQTIHLALRPASAGSNAGTLAATTPKVTATLSGTQKNPGTLAATAPKVTATLSGTQKNPGALAATTPKVTASATGAQRNPGTLAATTPAAVAALAGQSANPGTLAASAPVVVAALAGQSVNPGTLAATTPKVTVEIADTVLNLGTLAAITPAVVAALAGQAVNPGTLAATTPKAAAVLTGTQRNPGTLAAAAPAVVAALAGQAVNLGSLAAVTPLAVAALAGQSVNPGTLAAQAPKVYAFLTGVMLAESGGMPGVLAVYAGQNMVSKVYFGGILVWP